jgi:hypothetical protein
MPITPDTKDWTWVLDRPCPECGFEAGAVEVSDVPEEISANAAAWDLVLQRPDVRRRPDDATWSALEYACHVRDVYRIFTARLRLMLELHDPLFENWDQDATAVQQRYDLQDPQQVRREVADAAEAAAAAFADVAPEQYGRLGRRSDGAVFTVRRLAQYFVHDPVHHLWDVTHD